MSRNSNIEDMGRIREPGNKKEATIRDVEPEPREYSRNVQEGG